MRSLDKEIFYLSGLYREVYEQFVDNFMNNESFLCAINLFLCAIH